MIHSKNHTDRPHNKLKYPSDIEHTWNEKKFVPNFISNILLADNKSAWFKRRYYLLASMLGMSCIIRNVIKDSSKVCCFNIFKQVNRLEYEKNLENKWQ